MGVSPCRRPIMWNGLSRKFIIMIQSGALSLVLGPFHWRYFACNSNSIETLPCCNSVACHQIATNFCTCNNSTAVVPCTNFFSDHCIRIEVRGKPNFHRIWVAMEKTLVKQGLGRLSLLSVGWELHAKYCKKKWIPTKPRHIYLIYIYSLKEIMTAVCTGDNSTVVVAHVVYAICLATPNIWNYSTKAYEMSSFIMRFGWMNLNHWWHWPWCKEIDWPLTVLGPVSLTVFPSHFKFDGNSVSLSFPV